MFTRNREGKVSTMTRTSKHKARPGLVGLEGRQLLSSVGAPRVGIAKPVALRSMPATSSQGILVKVIYDANYAVK